MPDIDVSWLDEAEEGEIVLVIAPSDAVDRINRAVVKHTTGSNGYCAYVTVSKPAMVLDRQFEKDGIDTDHLFYIDCAAPLAGAGAMTRAENIVYLRPQELTNISIAVSTVVESMPEETDRILLFDTLSTLMLYNNEEIVTRFTHAMATRIRMWGIKSVMLTLSEETDEKTKARIRQFCDRTIQLSDDDV